METDLRFVPGDCWVLGVDGRWLQVDGPLPSGVPNCTVTDVDFESRSVSLHLGEPFEAPASWFDNPTLWALQNGFGVSEMTMDDVDEVCRRMDEYLG